jgi:hypothetical protein
MVQLVLLVLLELLVGRLDRPARMVFLDRLVLLELLVLLVDRLDRLVQLEQTAQMEQLEQLVLQAQMELQEDRLDRLVQLDQQVQQELQPWPRIFSLPMLLWRLELERSLFLMLEIHSQIWPSRLLAVVVVEVVVVRPMEVAVVVAVMSLHFKHSCLALNQSLGSLVLED